MQVVALTNRGLERPRNEDNCLARAAGDLALLVVADGMGGHQAGNVASAIAVDTAERVWQEFDHTALLSIGEARSLVSNLILDANEQILFEAGSKGERRGMGTTLTAALLSGRRLTIGHIGDSRAYLINGSRITLLTKDHSLLEKLIDSGEVDPAEAQNHPQRHILTRALGVALNPDLDIDLVELEVEADSTILLCTDGLTGLVRDEEILSLCLKQPEPQLLAEALINLANARGGYDNITVVLAAGIGGEQD